MKGARYTKAYFSDDEAVIIRRVVDYCWDYIADDIFVDENGKRDESLTFKNWEVVEVALDAGRWGMCFEGSDPMERGCTDVEFRKLLDRLFALSPTGFERACNDIMPYEIYGY